MGQKKHETDGLNDTPNKNHGRELTVTGILYPRGFDERENHYLLPV